MGAGASRTQAINAAAPEVIATRIAAALAVGAFHATAATVPDSLPFDWIPLLCFAAIALFFLLLLSGSDADHGAAERLAAEREQADSVHRADEEWTRAERNRAQWGAADDQERPWSGAAADDALREAEALAADAHRAKRKADAALERAKAAAEEAHAEWDAALHAATWARHDLDQARAAEVGSSAPAEQICRVRLATTEQ
jgi:hypothetical protein